VRTLEIWAFSDIGHWQRSIEEHEEILQAIEARQFDKAIKILENNRLTTYREFTKMAESTEPAD
jgi:DNA-binding GntR family transcriptional regulator